MCDKELLIGFLYDELQGAEREAFGRHLASCAACRGELERLRGTRVDLASWSPPDPDLGFQIVRRAEPAPAPRRWQPSPAWWLAAAAVLLLAVSAAIANVEVSVGGDGISVRTGWNRAPVQAAVTAPGPSIEEVERISARLKELEGQMAVRPVSVAASSTTAGMSDAELLRTVRGLIAESEERQQGELGRQILQVNRDNEVARRTDFDRLLTALRAVQGTTVRTSLRQKELEDQFMRVAFQR